MRLVEDGRPTGEWLGERLDGIHARKSFTDTLKTHGVTDVGYGVCTNAVYRGVFGSTAAELKKLRGLHARQNLRDELAEEELASVRLVELYAAKKIETSNAHGTRLCAEACEVVGDAIRSALQSVI